MPAAFRHVIQGTGRYIGLSAHFSRIRERFACEKIDVNSCLFIGPLRTMLLSGLEGVRKLRIRLTILNGQSCDFTYDPAATEARSGRSYGRNLKFPP
jgi:hypothetical protein